MSFNGVDLSNRLFEMLAKRVREEKSDAGRVTGKTALHECSIVDAVRAIVMAETAGRMVRRDPGSDGGDANPLPPAA